MWGKFRRVGVVSIVAASALAVAPMSASAAEQCTGPLGTWRPVTVGVAGDPVATVPVTNVNVCVRVGQGSGSGLPQPYAECAGGGFDSCYNGITVALQGSDFSFVEVTVTYTANGVTDSETVRVPGTGDPGTSTCVLFYGLPQDNPGDCLLFVER